VLFGQNNLRLLLRLPPTGGSAFISVSSLSPSPVVGGGGLPVGGGRLPVGGGRLPVGRGSVAPSPVVGGGGLPVGWACTATHANVTSRMMEHFMVTACRLQCTGELV